MHEFKKELLQKLDEIKEKIDKNNELSDEELTYLFISSIIEESVGE